LLICLVGPVSKRGGNQPSFSNGEAHASHSAGKRAERIFDETLAHDWT
jgi:hypothetical protein